MVNPHASLTDSTVYGNEGARYEFNAPAISSNESAGNHYLATTKQKILADSARSSFTKILIFHDPNENAAYDLATEAFRCQ